MKKKLANIFYNGLYQMFSVLIPLITMPYVSRVIGAKGLGINSYIMALIVLLGIFINSAFSQIGPREIAGEERDKVTERFINIWAIQVFIGIVILLIYLFFIKKSEYKSYYLIQVPYILGFILDISWLYLGLENLKKVIIRNTLVKISVLLFIFLLVKGPGDLYIYMWINSLGIFLGNIMFFVGINQNFNVNKLKLNKKLILKYIPQMVTLLVPLLTIQTYQYISRFFLEHYSTSTDVSYFDQSQKFARVVIQLLTSVSLVVMPMIASFDKKNNKEMLNNIINISLSYSLSLSCLGTIILIKVSPDFVPLFFGSNFIPMIDSMKVSSLIIVPIVVGAIFSNQLLLGKGLYKRYMISYIISGFIGIILSFITKNNINYLLASYILVVVELISCFIRIFVSRDLVDFKLIFKDLYKELIIVLFISFLSFDFLKVKGFFKVSIIVFIIISLYCFLSILFKTKTFKDISKNVRKFGIT